MSDNKWIINRAGLVNFWYYDDEEFNFSDGKLLLRGSNGSGKSVTMQSFIPLLLDGNKSPERLDPFGSKARKIENYLLGDEESGKDEAIGYLYMEFKKRETENYLTIGMGFKAARGKPVKSWGFAVTDGRRIGRDLFLYKEVGEKLPLTMKELENRLGSGGQLREGQGDYMKLVNDLLFGFNDIEEYDELVKLLVQLRTPKLSKDFKPTVVYEIMENSLQPLSEDDLRPMSEAIENMDNIKSRLEELKESKKAADKIKTAFDRYNSFIIGEKAKAYVTSRNEFERLIKDRQNKLDSREASEKAYKEYEDKFTTLDIDLKAAEEKKRQLDKHNSLQIVEEIADLEVAITRMEKDKRDKSSQLERKRDSEREILDNIKKLEGIKDEFISKVEVKLNEMNDLAEEFSYDEQVFLKDELEKDFTKAYSFSYIEENLKGYIEAIEKAVKALEEENRKNLEYDKTLEKLENSKREREAKSRVLEQARLLLLEIKEEFKEKLYGFRKTNIELKLSEDCLIAVSREIDSFNESSSFDGILSHIRKEMHLFEGALKEQLYKVRGEKDKLKREASEKKSEIEEWKSKKDPEPAREEKVTANRKALEKQGIPYLPLYKAVDFKDGLEEEVKGRLEEALLDMGLLDALIVPDKYKNKIMSMDSEGADKYVFSSPKFLMHDVSELLKVASIDGSGISVQDVDNALKSILIDKTKDSTYINESGEYSIGVLKGRVSGEYSAKFIGTAARKKYREELINKLNSELSLIEDNIHKYEAELDAINKRLEALSKEFNSFPSSKDLLSAVGEVKNAQFNYDKSSEAVLNIEKEERILYSELGTLREKVYELTNNLPIKANLDGYTEALQASKEYSEELHRLEKLHASLISAVEKLGMYEEQKEAVIEDLDNLRYDLGITDRKLREASLNYNNLKDQLKLSDYEAVKQEIERCIKLLRSLPKEMLQVTADKTEEKARFTRIAEELRLMETQLITAEKLTAVYEQSFAEECRLNYAVEPSENEDYFKLAKKLIRELSSGEEKNIKDKEDYVNALLLRFQENNQNLREYNVRIENIFESDYEEASEDLRKAYLSRKRLNIISKVRGKDVSFYKLVEFIAEGLEENEKLLRESDRQLFEDILVKNISKKIRAKIFHSENWVKEMNRLMESMNTSSGLSFSLRWTSNKAETEEQLDTKELVELLKQDGNLMKESDLNKLSEHFRSKIAQARRALEDKGQNQTFHSIMREVLDYRKWFEFKLYYVKTGQSKKELTNNAFYQFSGGEKAMAMYVPLFSAVYARYEGARKDSPRIISLDEAFAGVDEKNIRDMFRLLNELDLTYVINSQILWGDYDTVPSLAISELIRPDNADFVTVIRYHWNGKIKELVV